MQPNGHRVGSKNNNNFPGVFRKLYGNHRLNFVNSNEAKVFQDSPDSKIPTLSEAMRGQNVTKLDLLARNEAVSFYVILIFSNFPTQGGGGSQGEPIQGSILWQSKADVMHEILQDWNTHNIYLLPVLLLVHRSCPYLLLRNRLLNVFTINIPLSQIHKHILLTTKKLSLKLCCNRGSLHVNNLKQGSTKGGKIRGWPFLLWLCKW